MSATKRVHSVCFQNSCLQGKNYHIFNARRIMAYPQSKEKSFLEIEKNLVRLAPQDSDLKLTQYPRIWLNRY